jgi:AraC-like DNA-binding protein
MEPAIVACYREFAPHPALQRHVRAFFTFTPQADEIAADRSIKQEVLFRNGDSFSSPLFADGHVSMVFDLGMKCRADGVWRRDPAGPRGHVIGAMSKVGPTSDGDRPEMLGIYFQPGQVFPFVQVPATELTNRILPLEELWGAAGMTMVSELSEANAIARIDRLEAVLLRQLGARPESGTALDVLRLAAWILRRRGQVTVQCLADEAGVSRQHLTHMFRQAVGVSPKRYCRLARFQSGLAYAGSGNHVQWAGVSADMGYTDQSHMIAEFREFSSLTPQRLATERWLHPFIERARASRGRT